MLLFIQGIVSTVHFSSIESFIFAPLAPSHLNVPNHTGISIHIMMLYSTIYFSFVFSVCYFGYLSHFVYDLVLDDLHPARCRLTSEAGVVFKGNFQKFPTTYFQWQQPEV